MKKEFTLSLATLLAAGSVFAANVITRQANVLVPANSQKLEMAGTGAGLQALPAKAPALKAAPANAVYFEDFDDLAEDWTLINNSDASSTTFFRVGSLTNFAAVSGSYYFISGYDSAKARNGYAITPGIELEAGKTYNVNGFVYTPGYGSNLDEIRFTVGREATVEAQTTTVLDLTGDNAASLTAWTLKSGTFTPTESGTYYFAINHCTTALDVNAIAVDDFSVTEGAIEVEPSFNNAWIEGGLQTLDHNKLYMGKQDVTYLKAEYANADTCYWNVEGEGAISLTFENGYAGAMFTQSGNFKAVATAELGQKTTTLEKDLEVVSVDENTKATDYVGNMVNPANEAYYTTNGAPAAGLNQYFTGLFEVYQTPVKASVNKVKADLSRYNLSEANLAKNVKVQVLVNGESAVEIKKEFEVPASELFGTQVVSETTGPRTIEYVFPEAVEVDSLFLVGFDFSELTYSTNQLLGFVMQYGNLTNTGYVMYNNTYYAFTNIFSGTPIYNTAIYPELTFNPETTAVADAVATKTVAGVTYYNLAGVASATPFDGVNVKVVRYTDGSKQAVKVTK